MLRFLNDLKWKSSMSFAGAPILRLASSTCSTSCRPPKARNAPIYRSFTTPRVISRRKHAWVASMLPRSSISRRRRVKKTKIWNVPGNGYRSSASTSLESVAKCAAGMRNARNVKNHADAVLSTPWPLANSSLTVARRESRWGESVAAHCWRRQPGGRLRSPMALPRWAKMKMGMEEASPLLLPLVSAWNILYCRQFCETDPKCIQVMEKVLSILNSHAFWPIDWLRNHEAHMPIQCSIRFFSVRFYTTLVSDYYSRSVFHALSEWKSTIVLLEWVGIIDDKM